MQKIYRIPIIKTMVYANVFISFCAMAMVLVTYMVFPIPINFENNTYLLFVLLSTYLQYNVQRGYSIFQKDDLTERSKWVTAHKKTLIISIAICLITVLFLCNSLSYTSIAIMVGAEILSTLYYLPPFSFRKHGYVKPFLISLIWVISCVTVPLIENNLLTQNSSWFMVSHFFFIATLCTLFDIKDAEEDYLNGVNTYANKFGINVTKTLCIAMTILSSVGYLFFKHETMPLFLISLIVGIITLMATVIANEKRHPFFYYLWIDGLILIQALLVFIFSR